VLVGVLVGELVGELVGVLVGDWVGDLVAVPDGVLVGELVAVTDGVLVGVLVAVVEAVEVGTGVAVLVGAPTGPVVLLVPQPFAMRMTGLTNRNSTKRNFWFIICGTFCDFENMNPLFFYLYTDLGTSDPPRLRTTCDSELELMLSKCRALPKPNDPESGALASINLDKKKITLIDLKYG